MTDLSIIWDLDEEPGGNVQHIAEHGITKDEVEEVLDNHHDKAVASHSSGLPAAFGWTSTGKHLIVVFERVLADPLTLRPVTAYEAPPPATRKGKKRGR